MSLLKMLKAGADQDAVEALAEKLEEENARLRQWVADCQSGMWINCVYCGHRYGPADATAATIPEAEAKGAATMADALRIHIESCPHHPMSAYKHRLEYAAGRLKAFLAASEPLSPAAVGGLDATALLRLGELQAALGTAVPIEQLGEAKAQLQQEYDALRAKLAEIRDCWTDVLTELGMSGIDRDEHIRASGDRMQDLLSAATAEAWSTRPSAPSA